MGRLGLGEEHHSAGRDIVGANEWQEASVSGRVDPPLLFDGLYVAWHFREVLCLVVLVSLLSCSAFCE